MAKTIIIIIYVIIFPYVSVAQEDLDTNAEFDVYRPKIIEVSYSSFVDYHTASMSESYGNSSTQFKSDNLLKLKLGIPIILKKEKKLGVQFKYSSHHFVLDEDADSNYALYRHLNSTTFKSIAARAIYERSLDSKNKFTVLAGTEIKSDQLVWNTNSTKHFLDLEWKKDISDKTQIGAGLVAGSVLGIFQIYPIFFYKHQVSHRWTLDMKLPKSVEMRCRVNEGLYVIGRTTLRGWRYNVNNALPEGSEQHTIRRSSLEISLNIEQELHDWLWVGFNAGIMKNINYFLSEPGARRRDALIDLEAEDMKFIRASIFIVPPKKLYK